MGKADLLSLARSSSKAFFRARCQQEVQSEAATAIQSSWRDARARKAGPICGPSNSCRSLCEEENACKAVALAEAQADAEKLAAAGAGAAREAETATAPGCTAVPSDEFTIDGGDSVVDYSGGVIDQQRDRLEQLALGLVRIVREFASSLSGSAAYKPSLP